jgi:hypothetical protein
MCRSFIIFLICVPIIFFTSCHRDEDLLSIGNISGPSIESIIKIASVSNYNIADSVTATMISIKINPESIVSKKEVKFNTSLGKFSNNDTSITINSTTAGMASAFLTSNKSGVAIIKATVDGYSVDTLISFMPAMPQDMQVESDKYLLDTIASTTANITSKLYRDTGVISDPVKVIFNIKSDSAHTLPLLSPSFQFSDKKQVITTLTNPFKSQGWFTITASTVKQNGDTLSRSIRIKIN